MNKPLNIEPVVLRRLAALPAEERIECILALCELPFLFGRPHVHSGLGIRKLTHGTFECRGNRALRFLFEDRSDSLRIVLVGDHNEVKTYLRHK